MNVQLKDITVTARDGRVSHLEQVYIRGSHVRFFIVPDMLRCVHTCYSPAESVLGGPVEIANTRAPGTPPCSAAATSAAGVSVSREEGRRSAGRGPVVVVGDKKDLDWGRFRIRIATGTAGRRWVVGIWRSGLHRSGRKPELFWAYGGNERTGVSRHGALQWKDGWACLRKAQPREDERCRP